MDITLEMVKAYQQHCATVTDEALAAALDEGAQAASSALANDKLGSLFLMDETSLNKIQNAYATGWNRTIFQSQADKNRLNNSLSLKDG